MFETSTKYLKESMSEAVKGGDWEALRLYLDNVADITTESLIHLASDDVAVLQALIEELFKQIVDDHEVTEAPGPEQAVSMLAAFSSVLDCALERMVVPVQLTEMDGKILRTLARMNNPCSGLEIARYVGADQTIVSRRLPLLEDAGLVRRTRKGKRRENVISELGRRAIQEFGEREIYVSPTSTRSSVLAEEAANAWDDVRNRAVVDVAAYNTEGLNRQKRLFDFADIYNIHGQHA